MAARKWGVGPSLHIKDGDRVVIWWSEGYRRDMRQWVVTTVRKTKTQLIPTDKVHGIKFYHDGSMVGRDGYMWRTIYHIEPFGNGERVQEFENERAADAKRALTIKVIKYAANNVDALPINVREELLTILRPFYKEEGK